MSDWPMSSPQMTTILGFFCWAWADDPSIATTRAVAAATATIRSVLPFSIADSFGKRGVSKHHLQLLETSASARIEIRYVLFRCPEAFHAAPWDDSSHNSSRCTRTIRL